MTKLKLFIQDFALILIVLSLFTAMLFIFAKLGGMKITQQEVRQSFKPEVHKTPPPKIRIYKLGIDYKKKGMTLEEILGSKN